MGYIARVIKVQQKYPCRQKSTFTYLTGNYRVSALTVLNKKQKHLHKFSARLHRLACEVPLKSDKQQNNDWTSAKQQQHIDHQLQTSLEIWKLPKKIFATLLLVFLLLMHSPETEKSSLEQSCAIVEHFIYSKLYQRALIQVTITYRKVDKHGLHNKGHPCIRVTLITEILTLLCPAYEIGLCFKLLSDSITQRQDE